MKRFLLVLTALFFVKHYSSATVTLLMKHDNSLVTNGTMLHHYGDVTETLLNWHDLRVVNNTGTTTKINMKRYTISAPATVEDYFCWYVCLGSVESVSNPTLLHTAGSCFNSNNLDTLNYFGAYLKPQGILGTAVYRFVWFNVSNPNDSAYVDLTFHVTPVSVQEINRQVTMTTYPNPANEVVNLNIENADFNSTIIAEIYDIIGNKVLSQTITNSQTALDVSELSAGAYICNIVSNRKAILTKRIIISR